MSSLDYLLSLQKFGIKLGLDNINHLLGRLGNPHRQFPAIHVAGTNGKGSVVAFIHSVLIEMGYRVGRFTSPHLVDFSERILINHDLVTDDEIDDLVEGIRPVVDEMGDDPNLEHPTFFEAVTAMAFLHFARENVDFAVVEVGMGGRYDSTNVVDPCVTVVNNVHMEHSDYLGDTVEKIAFEKAGIIKPGVEVVSAAREPDVRKVIDARAGECNTKAYYLSSDFSFDAHRDAYPRQYMSFTSPWSSLDKVEINLPGEFQAQNAAVALMSLEILRRKGSIIESEAALRRGMAAAKWPARLEKLAEEPLIILDSAHNPAAMTASADAIIELFPERKTTLVVGMLSDKDVASALKSLKALSDTIVVTQPNYGRALPGAELADAARQLFGRVEHEQTIADAIRRALALTDPNGMILITGSLFNVAEVRAFMDKEGVGARMIEQPGREKALQTTHFLGIDIGATLIKMGIVTREGRLIRKERIETEKMTGPAHFVEMAKEATSKLIADASLDGQAIGAIGIGAPGWVEHDKGIVRDLTNIPDWRDFPLAREMESATGLKCFVDNDTNVMAVGELIHGAGRGYRNLVCITLGTGVGGAIVIDGAIYRGAHGSAGELGHVTLDFNGPQCACGGVGCLESYVGNRFIVGRALEQIERDPDKGRGSVLLGMAGGRPENITTRLLAEAAEKGDEIALDIWAQTARFLGIALAGLANVFDPECFIIGGGVAKAGPVLFDRMKETMEALAMNEFGYSTPLIKAELGEDAGIIGAATFAMISSEKG